jgi:hypothetical protein
MEAKSRISNLKAVSAHHPRMAAALLSAHYYSPPYFFFFFLVHMIPMQMLANDIIGGHVSIL